MVRITAQTAERWQSGSTIDMNASMMSLSLEIVARTLFATEVAEDIREITEQTNEIMGI